MTKTSLKAAATLCFAAATLVSTAASAAYLLPLAEKREETRFGVGLQWDFGDKTPQFVASVRRTQTRTDNSVVGGRFELTIPLMNDHRPMVRLLGLAGNRNIQGEAGLGYRFATSEFQLGLGAQAPYVNAGVNWGFSTGLKPYLGVNTFGRAPAPGTSAGAVFPPP